MDAFFLMQEVEVVDGEDIEHLLVTLSLDEELIGGMPKVDRHFECSQVVVEMLHGNIIHPVAHYTFILLLYQKDKVHVLNRKICHQVFTVVVGNLAEATFFCQSCEIYQYCFHLCHVLS